MTRFTGSPFERMMTRRPESGRLLPVLLLYPLTTPVMAAGTMDSPVWAFAIGKWSDG